MKKYNQYTVKEKKKFWNENPVTGEIDIIIPRVPEFKMYNENDDTVIKELYWTNFQGWETTSLRLWSELLKIVGKDSVILDIGSYSGIYSLIAASITSSKILSFDIQENCVERLKRNIEINGFRTVEVIHGACTDNNGTATFYYYEEKGIISSVAGLKPKQMNNLEKKVKALKIDDYLVDNNISNKVALIKIDVEGAEIGTLKGMAQTLSKHNPHVLIEVNDFRDLRKVKKLFPMGYDVYDIDEDSYLLKKLGLFKKPSKHRNYLFTTLKKMELKNLFDGEVE